MTKKQVVVPDTKVFIKVFGDCDTELFMDVTFKTMTVRFTSSDSVFDLFEQLGRKSKGDFIAFVQYCTRSVSEHVSPKTIKSLAKRNVLIHTIDH